MDYSIYIEGTLVSVQQVEKKTYGDKVSEEKSVLSFVRVLEDGKLETLKVKAPYNYNGKAGDKVKLNVSISAMAVGNSANIYYSLISKK